MMSRIIRSLIRESSRSSLIVKWYVVSPTMHCWTSFESGTSCVILIYLHVINPNLYIHKSNTNREHSVQLILDGFSAFNLCLHGSVMFIIPSTRLQSLGIEMYTHLSGFLSQPASWLSRRSSTLQRWATIKSIFRGQEKIHGQAIIDTTKYNEWKRLRKFRSMGHILYLGLGFTLLFLKTTWLT